MGEEKNKWISKLLGFYFEIKYKPGKENRVVDALSRQIQYAAIYTVRFLEWDDLEAEIKKDTRLQQIIQDLLMKTREHSGYHINQGRLYY